MKIAGIRKLDFERFFAIFGRGRLAEFPQVYRHELREELTPASRRWWDRHVDFFDGSGRAGELFIFAARPAISPGCSTATSTAWPTCAMRSKRCWPLKPSRSSARSTRPAHGAVWRPLLKWLLRRDSTLSLLGVPRPHREQLDRDYSGGVCGFIEDSLRAVFTYLPLHDNYFWPRLSDWGVHARLLPRLSAVGQLRPAQGPPG